MTLTAELVILVVILLFSFTYSAEALCDGSALKGFIRCSLIPIAIANLVIPVYLLSVGVLAAWCLVATTICGWAELTAIRERNSKQ